MSGVNTSNISPFSIHSSTTSNTPPREQGTARQPSRAPIARISSTVRSVAIARWKQA
jgi:hypothetical protein